MAAAKTGLAFSGGGIRSAAFCSGVLRRLLQRGVTADHLSCVSGGGYTGTAYFDWKFHHDQKDDPKWHKKFFNRMRRSAIFCNWGNPIVGCLDTMVMLILVSFAAVVFPAIVWLSPVCPLAYAVDFLIGKILIAQEPCPGGVRLGAEGGENDELCVEEAGSLAYIRSLLFAILLSLAVVFYLLGRFIPKARQFLQLLVTTCLVLFAFSFLPWIIHEYLSQTSLWVQGIALILGAALWFSVPLMRQQASLVIMIFFYSYVIHLRVFKVSLFSVIEYSDRRFTMLMVASGFVLWIAPAVGTIQQRLVYIYNRWCLQKAFYTNAGAGTCGCGGITTADCFLDLPDYQKQSLDPERPLSLADLEGIMPQYICNAVVNKWQRKPEDRDYELITMTPTGIERLDCPPGEDEIGTLMPRDIKLSQAMAASAAAVSPHMGKYEDTEAFKDLQIILGIGMGTNVLSDPRAIERSPIILQVMPAIIEFVRVLPLIVFAILHLMGWEETWMTLGVFIFIVILALFALIGILPLNNENPGLFSKALRWIIVHVPFVRYVRHSTGIIHHGSTAPPVLFLSDGGHFENLGLLPLLKLRLKKIVLVNGGFTENDSTYGDDLLRALDLSRQKLRCSFLGLDGRDVAEDLRSKFVDKVPGGQPRSYRFKVQYYDKPNNGQEELVGEGEILLISPRHPRKGVIQKESVTWKEALRDIDVDLETGRWGKGPGLEADEADRLTFCCCDCCHSLCCRRFSKFLCGEFPLHITANQFFTPTQFSAYHREGYRASVEADAAEFLIAD